MCTDTCRGTHESCSSGPFASKGSPCSPATAYCQSRSPQARCSCSPHMLNYIRPIWKSYTSLKKGEQGKAANVTPSGWPRRADTHGPALSPKPPVAVPSCEGSSVRVPACSEAPSQLRSLETIAPFVCSLLFLTSQLLTRFLHDLLSLIVHSLLPTSRLVGLHHAHNRFYLILTSRQYGPRRRLRRPRLWHGLDAVPQHGPDLFVCRFYQRKVCHGLV
ncbi:hypothetical protein BDV96DRAFT_192268 [Lophiotrema nucula]|uniref:Uncharacterized protein n=1 Tax=Lophiotrema nucula TaxID=690887 RepID=A0A6A5YUQ1_9PLEO|nr:hypothetical protein BDV96DRAFT_192268 [Lophiotrema nucula]